MRLKLTERMESEEYFWWSLYAAAFTFVVAVFVWLGVRYDRIQQVKAVEGIKDEVRCKWRSSRVPLRPAS